MRRPSAHRNLQPTTLSRAFLAPARLAAVGALAVAVAGVATAQCPTANFPPVNPHPANAQYPDPFLDVRCTADELIVEANGIPAYEFQPITPNPLQAQAHEWRIPLQPRLSVDTQTIPLLGPVAIAVNGMPIFGPNEGPMPDPWGDPVYNGIMDFCQGHTARGGVYHYHALLVECLTAGQPPGQPSPIIGYSFDGFPIHGPWGCLDEACTQVVQFESSWVQTGDPTTYAWDNHEYVPQAGVQYLDECNGRIGPDGTYRYHATDTFPYILGCYHGFGGPPPVPEGRLGSQPLRVTKLDALGGRLEVSWDERCAPTETFLVHGALEQVARYGHDGSRCAVAMPETWDGVPGGNLWFLLVGSDGAGIEGPWGAGTFGERNGTLPTGRCGNVAKDLSGVCF